MYLPYDVDGTVEGQHEHPIFAIHTSHCLLCDDHAHQTED